MKKTKKRFVSHILNFLTIALIVESFLCTMMVVKIYARENCFERIEETTEQMSQMLTHAMNEKRNKLTLFADILAANNENPDALLHTYMKNFCQTQYFSAVCIHRANGVVTTYGAHPHMHGTISFEEEVAKLPYVSEVFALGSLPEENYIYQAVPIIRNDETIAILYGYMSLDVLPHFIASNAYDGKCEFYVVDGNTGVFLMDEYHGTLGNIYDGSLGKRITKPGYDVDEMCENVYHGKSGYLIFKSQKTGDWYYTYYMPMGINNWSMQLTIDETTAFASYNDISNSMLWLMICVIVLMVLHVFILMYQNARAVQKEKQRSRKTWYINNVQRALLSAHNNPDFVDKALAIVAEEMQAETVLLLSFTDKIVTNAQYFPSKDKAQAMNLVGRNIREDFPNLFDMLSANTGVYYDGAKNDFDIAESAKVVFQSLEMRNLALVPITDPAGALKGALAAVNLPGKPNLDMLECVTYDFFMAITNLENHMIIKNMGAMDYLTGIKNRNSYESEIGSFTGMTCNNLWCVFVDVNGLHEVNNTQGHKAGDRMLCTVADAMKRVFGDKYTYRIGGDEFVAFVPDSNAEELYMKKKSLCAELAVKDYYISVGFEGCDSKDGVFDVEHIVSLAENHMYRDKREYYRNNGILPDRGHFPVNSEE